MTIDKVSIVVPMYNSALYIVSSISSLLSQTYRNYEIIVVDDFSSDDSFSKVSDLVNQNANVLLYKNEIKGANSARQLGVSKAVGTYVVFMDADDSWDERALEKLVGLAVPNDCDLVCCNMKVSVAGEIKKTSLFSFDDSSRAFRLDDERDFECVYDVPPSACAKLFKRELLRSINFIDVPFSQDWNISYKYLAKCKLVMFLSEPLYTYQVSELSTSSYSNKTAEDVLFACRSILDISFEYSGLCREMKWARFLFYLESRYFISIVSRAACLANSRDGVAVYRRVVQMMRYDRSRMTMLAGSIFGRGEFLKLLALWVICRGSPVFRIYAFFKG